MPLTELLFPKTSSILSKIKTAVEDWRNWYLQYSGSQDKMAKISRRTSKHWRLLWQCNIIKDLLIQRIGYPKRKKWTHYVSVWHYQTHLIIYLKNTQRRCSSLGRLRKVRFLLTQLMRVITIPNFSTEIRNPSWRWLASTHKQNRINWKQSW